MPPLLRHRAKLRYALKSLLYTAGVVLSFVLLYLAAAYGLARIAVNSTAARGNDVEIYLLNNGVHIDVVLPVRTDQIDWSRLIRFGHTRGGDTTLRYVAFGWGDRNFYLNTPTWGDLTVSTAFKAATGLSSTAIHATFHDSLEENESCVRLGLSRDEYARLIDFVHASFHRQADGRFRHIPTNAVYGNHDAFYEATGRYSVFHTCNTWANNALKSAGQKACWWTPFGSGIFYHYRRS